MPDVAYTLTLDGQPAPAELLEAVRQVDVEDHADKADMLRIRLSVAVKEDGSGWTVLDDETFSRLARVGVSVQVGSGDAVPLIDAYVVETVAALSDQPGESTLTVVAMDPTVLMHLEEKVKAWPNQKDSQVAEAVFGDGAYGFTPVVEQTAWTRDENEQVLIQRGTDIRFLQMLAERNGYECYVELADGGEVEGHFHPPRLDLPAQGTLKVNLGAETNVSGFRVSHDLLGPAAAQAQGLDMEGTEPQRTQAREPSHKPLGAAATKPGDRPRTVLLAGMAMPQAGEMQAYAQAVVDRAAWSVRADGELNAVAYGGVLRAKRPVLVQGAGKHLSGEYYVERVLHTFAAGSYTQRFTLRRNAAGARGGEPFGQDEAR